jgi:hypothetical protein
MNGRLAEREGLTSTALILPTTLANFCFSCQRYQSFATERTCILPVFLENQITPFLVAMVVSLEPAERPGSRMLVEQ